MKKKILASILAVCMFAGLAVPAFAEGNPVAPDKGSIAVNIPNVATYSTIKGTNEIAKFEIDGEVLDADGNTIFSNLDFNVPANATQDEMDTETNPYGVTLTLTATSLKINLTDYNKFYVALKTAANNQNLAAPAKIQLWAIAIDTDNLASGVIDAWGDDECAQAEMQLAITEEAPKPELRIEAFGTYKNNRGGQDYYGAEVIMFMNNKDGILENDEVIVTLYEGNKVLSTSKLNATTADDIKGKFVDNQAKGNSTDCNHEAPDNEVHGSTLFSVNKDYTSRSWTTETWNGSIKPTKVIVEVKRDGEVISTDSSANFIENLIDRTSTEAISWETIMREQPYIELPIPAITAQDLVTYNVPKDGKNYLGVQARIIMPDTEKAKLVSGDTVSVKLYAGTKLLATSTANKTGAALGTDIFKNTYDNVTGYASTLFSPNKPYPSSSWTTTNWVGSDKPTKFEVVLTRNGKDTVVSKSGLNEAFVDGINTVALSWAEIMKAQPAPVTPPTPPSPPPYYPPGGGSGGSSSTTTDTGTVTEGTGGRTDVSFDNVGVNDTTVTGGVTVATSEIKLDSKVMSEATAANPVEITATISTSDATAAIANASTNTVELKLVVPNDVYANANISIAEINVDSEVFAQAKESGKTLTFTVETPNGQVLATWTFDGKAITGTGIDANLAVNVKDAPAGMSAVVKDPLLVSFNHSGKLPGTAKVNISVVGKYINGQKLYLYYNNTATGKLELAGDNIVVQDGRVTISINHCSDYVLAAAPAATTTTGTTPPATGVDAAAYIGWTVTLLALAGIAILGKKKLLSK